MTTGLLWTAASFLAGSLPTGYLLGLWLKGVDIRTVGSGNVGATNVFRIVGKAAGAATLAVDIAKGFMAVAGALALFGGGPWPVWSGLAAVAGHSWSPWLGFRGGKGVATSAGVFLALLPGPVGVAVLAFLAGFLASRRVSVGSLLGAAALPLAAWLLGSEAPRTGLALILSVVVIARHAPNIRRLIRGEEPPVRFSSKKEAHP